ncbi:phosphate-starvation-inducible PsiE family protein [Oceanithermus sp.]|uniref:phosphate-starvation-inducible PsiE family protein n=1 Tax=Oceanithermus sp. TaxID=2268145 RepID=UPI0025D21FA3|nr:phosphate-starvation-inducible PsiE family protein [Oceanithermus sp.]
MQGPITRLYKLSIQIAFNLAIVVLVLGMFVGVWRVLANLGRTLGPGTTPEAFQTLIIDALTLLVVIELVRTFVDYFEWERVRIHVLLDAGAIFLLRELIIQLYAHKFGAVDVVGWTAGILLLLVARTLAVRWQPPAHRDAAEPVEPY